MKINNCFISLLILMFSWSVLIPQSYEEASGTVKEAEVLKDDGQYDESYTKTQEALNQIDSTSMGIFSQIMNLKIGESKTLADKALADAKKSGAATDAQFKPQYDKAMTLYNSANASNTAAAAATTNLTLASNSYTFALNSFDTVAKDVAKVENDYIAREKGVTSKAIADVKTQYNNAIKSKSIVKGDNIDKVVAQALASADTSLKANDFQAARKQAENALAQVGLADKKHADLMKNAETTVNGSKEKYNNALAQKTIKKGNEDDGKVSSLLKEAEDGLKTNSPAVAIAKADEASKYLDNVISANDKEKADVKTLIDNVKTQQNTMITDNTLQKDSEEDANITNLINDSETAYNSNDNTLAREKIVLAQTALTDLTNKESTDGVVEVADGTEATTDAVTEGDATLGDATGTVVVVDDTTTATDDTTAVTDETTAVTDETTAVTDGTTAVTDGTTATDETTAANTVNTEGKVSVLPEYYTVVSRVPLTDALWRIASMSFVYDEALYWERLYLENRNVLRDPNNPNLIFPGQVLKIPSILGESRAGTYDEALEYVTFEEALKLENIEMPAEPNY